MTRIRLGLSVLIAWACLAAWPAAAWAQGSSIAGTIKDTSGGVLPGVTVEVASPALIEGTKSTTTDGAGVYRVVDLRPGIYTVTFTMQGFATVRRTEVEVPAEFTVTLNGEMRVGALEETITVAGQGVTFVDVQSAARVQTLNKDAIDNIPNSRTIQTMGQLIPGVTISTGTPDVGGSNAAMQTYMTVRGIPSAQNTVMVDGMAVNGLEGNGAIQAYFNDAASEALVYQTSDTTAANSGGGVQVNMIPRTGGNSFSGDTQLAYRPGELQANNLTQRLRDLSVTTPPGNVYISDLTVAQGGPLARNKLWFFASARDNRVNNYVLDTRFDDGSPGHNAEYIRDVLGRLTWQVNTGGRLTGYYDRVWKHRANAMGALDDPETGSVEWTSPNYSTGSIKYTWSATSKLFFEGGYSFNIERRNQMSNGGVVDRQMEDVANRLSPNYQQNEWYARSSRQADGAIGTSSSISFQREWPERHNYMGSVSYVSGSHNIKAGFGWETGKFLHSLDAHGDLVQVYDSFEQDANFNPIFIQPLTVTLLNTPVVSQERMNANMGIYVQDQWTLRRLTINAGLRWEWINSQVDETTAPAGRFVPARTQVEVLDRPNWKDWAPRFSIVYDLFGNGKTALKYSLNRYNTAESTGLAEDYNVLGISTATNRQWTDLNGDDIAQGQRTWHPDGTYTDCVYQTPGCEIYLSGPSGVNPVTGASQTLSPLNPLFGLPGSVGTYDGFPRLYRVEQNVEIQHQLLPRLGLTFAYGRWNRYNNTSEANTGIDWNDYNQIQFFNPIDGTPLPFTYYSLRPEGTAKQDAPGAEIDYLNKDIKVNYNSYQMDFRAVPWAGAQLFGGLTLERTQTIDCTETYPGAVISPNSVRFCNDTDLLGDGSGLADPFIKHFKFGLSFPMMWGIRFSAAYQNLDQGAFDRTFTYGRTTQRYPNGTVTYRDATGTALPATPCPAGQATCAVPGGLSADARLIGTSVSLDIDIPGQNRDERLNQLDIKLSKQFRVRDFTFAPTFEVFNAFNADTILARNTAYANTAGTYLRPSSVLKPRILGFGLQMKW